METINKKFKTKTLKVKHVVTLPAAIENVPKNTVPLYIYNTKVYDMYLICDDDNIYLFPNQYILPSKIDWYKNVVVTDSVINIWQPRSKKLVCKGVPTNVPAMELCYYSTQKVGSGAIRIAYTGTAPITKADLVEHLI